MQNNLIFNYITWILILCYLLKSSFSIKRDSFDQIKENPFKIYYLSKYQDAKCLDGSPPAYYFSKASSESGSKKTIIFFEGGGWCGNDTIELTLQTCYERSFTKTGSSKNLSSIVSNMNVAIISGNMSINPFFYDWNRIYVIYCDGTGRQGSSRDPYYYNNTAVWFRGMNNTIRLFEDLISQFKINETEQIVLTGSSAGGLAVYTWTNYLRNLLPEKVKMWSISDSGFFLDYQNIQTQDYRFRKQFINMMYFVNREVDPVVQECVIDNPNDKWKCLFAQYLSKYIKVPFFLVQLQYDTWQLQNILGESCFMNKPSSTMIQCNYSQQEDIELMRHFSQQQIIQSVEQNSNRGVWLASCMGHCVLYYSFRFFNQNYTILEHSLNTAAFALYKWMYNIKDSFNWKYIDPLPWPSNCPCSKLPNQTCNNTYN